MIFRKLIKKLAWIRLVVDKNTRRFLLGPVAGSIPRTFIRSVVEASAEPTVRSHLQSVHSVVSAEVINYNLPEEFPYWFRRQKAFDRKNIYVLKNVIISPSSGLIWTDRGVLFGESIGDLFRLLGWGSCLHHPLIPSVTLPCDEPVVCCPDALYYHWLLEWLPNLLYALDLFPNLKILLCEKSPSFAREGLKLILGKEEYCKKVLISHCDTPVAVSQAILPALTEWSGFVHPKDIARIRQSIVPQFIKQSDRKNSTHIYVSRAHATRRRLPHENEIEKIFSEKDFEIIHGEELTFRDQINIFSRAETIIAPHGAGLSNMIWRSGPCRIVEIFTTDWLNDCYARLSTLLGFDYHYHMLQKPTTARETVDQVLELLSPENTTN